MSEIVFNGPEASSCHRKKILSAHSQRFFFFLFSPPLDSGKLKLFDLEVRNKESYFIQSENYMTAVRKG